MNVGVCSRCSPSHGKCVLRWYPGVFCIGGTAKPPFWVGFLVSLSKSNSRGVPSVQDLMLYSGVNTNYDQSY